jgi:hypothetical protein
MDIMFLDINTSVGFYVVTTTLRPWYELTVVLCDNEYLH